MRVRGLGGLARRHNKVIGLVVDRVKTDRLRSKRKPPDAEYSGSGALLRRYVRLPASIDEFQRR